jgi:hypothetical protein
MTTKLPNGHKIYQMAAEYSKWPHINQHFPIEGLSRFGIFRIKINHHLATLFLGLAFNCRNRA